jgi:hypothetical protein
VWLSNLLVLLALLGGAGVIAGAATLFAHIGWRVPLYVTAGIAVAYGVFLTLALVGYLLYVMDQEVRRGLRR